MTIEQAITKAAALKPSQFTDADMIDWLSTLDMQIYVEIMLTHEDAPETEFTGYVSEGDDATDTDTELLAPAPYDKMYVHYLLAQIDFYNGDMERFNNMQRRFEMEYGEYESWYNREHLPLQANSIAVTAPVDEMYWPIELTEG